MINDLQTQPERIFSETQTTIADLSQLFVIRYFDGIYYYWSGSGLYVSNINDARLYRTREHAQLVADSLSATKPIVVPIKIVEIDE